MKTKLILIATLMFLASQSFGQFSFGVSPGPDLNGAYFGYKVNNKLLPFVSLGYFNANFSTERTGERFDWDTNSPKSYSDLYEVKGTVLIPQIGAKYFINDNNKLQSYLLLSLSKPIFSGKVELGDETWDQDTEEDIEDAVKAIKIWGGEFGFGVEYFFDKNFSLGGEFGIRHYNLKYSDSYETTYYNPNTAQNVNTEIETTLKFNMNPTYSKITLNYYFSTNNGE
ncbi:MAG: hypothetical protein U9N85_07415 [Bacteroidota bacterium]|nr:hypothetical protein [Bacteroidota bacterium]